jgi:hypothetical protein
MSAIPDLQPAGPANFEDDRPAKAPAGPRPTGTNALVAAAVVAALGMVTGLGLMLIDGTGASKHNESAVMGPYSSVAPLAPGAVALIGTNITNMQSDAMARQLPWKVGIQMAALPTAPPVPWVLSGCG